MPLRLPLQRLSFLLRKSRFAILAVGLALNAFGVGVAVAQQTPTKAAGYCSPEGGTTRVACTRPVVYKDASADEIYAALFGAAPALAPALNYPVELIGLNRGDIRVTPGASPESTMIARPAIVELLLPLLVENEQTALLNSVGNKLEVSAAELTRLGYTTSFDANDFILKVDVPNAFRSVVPIPLQQRSNYAPTSDVVRQATTSAIINVFAGTTYVQESEERETGFTANQVNFDAAFNHRGLVLETGLRYSDAGESTLTRSDTRLTYDFVDRMIRTEAGDLTAPTAGLQGNPVIGGISAYREFRLRPDVNFRANPSQDFELQRTAQVSVFINGQFVQELRLLAGRYSLTDLPLRSGAGNDVVLEIQYDTGEIERVRFSAFYDFDLLKRNTSEFAFSAGPTSQIVEKERRYDTDNIAFSGYYRLGVSDRLTLGANAQGDRDLVNVGAEAIYATPIGLIGGSGAYSDHDLGAGSAATLFYRWTGAENLHQLRANLQARFQDEGYRRLGSSLGSSYRYDIAARFAGNLNRKARFQASAGYRSFYGTQGDEYSASVAGGYDIGPGSLSTTLSYFEGDRKPEWFLGLSYSVRLGRVALQAAHETRDRATRVSAAYQPNLAAGQLGYDASYTRQPGLDQYQMGAGYIGNRFDARAEQNFQDDMRNREAFSSLFLGSALVYADQSFALSRPVADSFAMFGPAPGTEAFKLGVDPIGGMFGEPGVYAATSSMLGNAVLPDLQSYYNRAVSVEAPDAPAGTSLGGRIFNLKPRYRSGFVIDVGSDRNVALLARLIDANGQQVKFAAGYALTDSGERIPVFSNAGGRIYVDNLKAGQKVRIDFTTPKGAWVEVQIPENSLGVVRLEEDLIIRAPADSKFASRAGTPEKKRL